MATRTLMGNTFDIKQSRRIKGNLLNMRRLAVALRSHVGAVEVPHHLRYSASRRQYENSNGCFL